MTQIRHILSKKDANILGKDNKIVPKTSVGRELINNLVERLKRRGNIMTEMEGHYIKRVRINLSSNFFAPKEKNFSIWVKPFIRTDKKSGHSYLMLNWDGVVLRASDIFGDSINIVRL